ncbi:MAG: hypothetical protein LBP54_05955 [Campylobacteraceae bacterium]|jgi:DNA-directed RNA polymerase sigma subunit (sigma70/sigma32)|nr:hypothetical protein [Campylobacteraceae bacterium]
METAETNIKKSFERMCFDFESAENAKNYQKTSKKKCINLTQEQLEQLETLDREYADIKDKPCEYYEKRAIIAFGACTELTLEEIGWALCITRERVRQLWEQAVKKLRHPQRCAKLREYRNL